MDKTYVFNSEPASSGKFDIAAFLPGLMGNNNLDPNLMLALNNGARNQDMWGGAGCWWMWIILLFFAWGRNGFGGWGGNANGLPAELQGDAGRQLLMNAIQGNGDAIRTLSTTLNCDVNSIKDSLCTIQGAIQSVGNQVGLSSQQIINAVQAGNCQLSGQIAQCCCDIRTAIERQGYEGRIATIQQTDSLKEDSAAKFNILGAKIDAQTQIINDKFCELEKREMQSKIDALRDQVRGYELSASQQLQTRNIIDAVRPCPVPSFPVCNPWGSNAGYFSYGYGYPYGGNGCGCGCNNNGCCD